MFSEDALNWIQKYDVEVTSLLRYNVGYSAKYNQIIYPWYDGTGRVIAWQGRNLTEGKNKYFTTGKIDLLLPIYHASPNSRELVIVEDCLSAIKIASRRGLNGPTSDAMPCLGSQVSPQKIKRLAGLYSRVWIWLDGNMLDSSLKMCKRFSMLGVHAIPVYTPLDPKEYSVEEIQERLQ